MTKPIYNWGINGHRKQLLALAEDLDSGNMPHAYLFTGPPNIGKYTLARRLAQILQCDEGGCGTCQVCINISKGCHPDTIEMVDAGESESVKIEPMRETLARLYTTTPGKYKILLVKNIERMTLEAANALLKTLEEPPSKVLFLFTSSNPEDLLQTVLSRVRVVKFSSLTDGEILALLHDRHPLEPDEQLQKIADLAFGLPGRAIRFMMNDEDFQEISALFERVRNVVQRGNIVEKFALVGEVTQDEKLFNEFFNIFLLALRYTMLDEAEQGGASRSQKLQRTIHALTQTQEAIRLQKRNVNARLLFEHLMLQT